MAEFPSNIYEPREIENVPGQTYDPSKKTRLYADDLNASNAEIVAIENVLGLEPQGDFDTVAERLDSIVSASPLLGRARLTYEDGEIFVLNSAGILSVDGGCEYNIESDILYVVFNEEEPDNNYSVVPVQIAPGFLVASVSSFDLTGFTLLYRDVLAHNTLPSEFEILLFRYV